MIAALVRLIMYGFCHRPGCLPYVIRVRVSYSIRNMDFASVKLKCRSTLCFCHYYTFTGFCIGGWVCAAGGVEGFHE